MKIAGLLLMISGGLMLIAFILQIPGIYEAIKYDTREVATAKIFYNLLLIAAGIFLVFIGRKVRRSKIS